MIIENPTRTEKTNTAYRTASGRLLRRFERESNLPFLGNQHLFFEWTLEKKDTWANGTWRYNKAALRFITAEIGLLKLNKLIASTDNKGGKENPKHQPPEERRTSAKKTKQVSDSAFKKIIAAAESVGNNYWATQGLYLFVASYYCGLRPCEYEHAEFVYHQHETGVISHVLRVKNAKHTNGRAHGKYRHISLNHFNDAMLEVISYAVSISKSPKNAHGGPITFDNFKRYASAAFSKFTQGLFPHRKTNITLYTARHQFCSNLKKAGFSPAEIAALMGHSSDATAMRTYGKKRFGSRSGYLPKPFEAEVAKVSEKGRTTSYFKDKNTEATSKKTTKTKRSSITVH